MTTCGVGYLIGSLASINRKLAHALVRLAPAELRMTEVGIGERGSTTKGT